MRLLFLLTFPLLLFACSEQENSDNSENFVSKSLKKISNKIFKIKTENASLQPVDYINWIEDEVNGLKVNKEVGDYQFTLQYKPLDYVVLSHFKREEVKESSFENKKKEFSDLQYYTLRIKSKLNDDLLKSGISTNQEEFARLEYFSFQMQNDIQLVDGNDTLSCVLHHFERTYNISPYSDFVLGFEISPNDKKGEKDRILLYNDRALNLGIIKLKIKKESIQNTPQLIYRSNESKI